MTITSSIRDTSPIRGLTRENWFEMKKQPNKVRIPQVAWIGIKHAEQLLLLLFKVLDINVEDRKEQGDFQHPFQILMYPVNSEDRCARFDFRYAGRKTLVRISMTRPHNKDEEWIVGMTEVEVPDPANEENTFVAYLDLSDLFDHEPVQWTDLEKERVEEKMRKDLYSSPAEKYTPNW